MKEWHKQWHNSGELMKDLKHIELENNERFPLKTELSTRGKYVGFLYDNLERDDNKAKLFRLLAERMEVCID